MERERARKLLLYIALVVLLVALVFVLAWYFAAIYQGEKRQKEPTQEEIIKKQLDELNALAPAQLNEEEVQEQLDDLNQEQPGEIKPLSEDEIQKQLDELNKL